MLLIGVMGEYNNIYYGVGCSGEGVVWLQAAGEIISQLYAGEDTEMTRFELVNRKIPYMPTVPLKKIGFKAIVRSFIFEDKYF